MTNETATTNGHTATPTPAVFRISEQVRSALRADVYPAKPADPDFLSDEEFEHFIAICEQRRLNPAARHIYATKRYDSKLKRKKMCVEATIDGLRLIAQRTGRYRGQTRTHWAGHDGQWRDVWLPADPPAAAIVGVWRHGDVEPITAVAHWAEYAQTTNTGALTTMWRDKPRLMLAKCAEAAALRKAFPEELGGLYTSEEMGRADSDPVAPTLDAPQTTAHTITATASTKTAVLEALTAIAAGDHALAGQWAARLAAAGLPAHTVAQCVSYAVEHSDTLTHAQGRFEAWIERKERAANQAADTVAMAPLAA